MENESDTDMIQSFVERGNYHAAINIAISSMNACRRNNDPAGIDKYLRIINNISITMLRDFGSKEIIDEITK